ncbi:hypothetical protein FS842_007076 [Serendipita sp. 407]|nr:hypothetical protein FS842_007076 [Serendipita sp. 407]
MASAPSARLTNERVNVEQDNTEKPTSNRYHQAYPVKVLGPLLLITSVGLAAGLVPYVVVRRHIMHNRRILSEIQGEVSRCNSRLKEMMSRAEVETAARQLHEQKLGAELDLRLKHLEATYHGFATNSNHQNTSLHELKSQLEAVNIRCQEAENLVEDVGKHVGEVVGQFAAFIEEEQLKRGEADKNGFVRRMRALALMFQSWRREQTPRNSPP